MSKYILRVTYKIKAHEISTFQEILENEVIPLVGSLGIKLVGCYQTTVGSVGEFMEIWEFDSLSEFEEKWNNLMNHPELLKIFEVTGPMVQDETFTIQKRLF